MPDPKAALINLFNKLQADSPVLLAGTTPLNFGSFGIVVDHGDHTVSKIFQRAANNPSAQNALQKVYDDEVSTLRLLNGTVFGDAHTPMIISETQLPESGEAFASYRMTKLPGQTIDWFAFVKNASPSEQESHFRNAGALLASFHDIATPLLGSIVSSPNPHLEWGTIITPVPRFDPKTNEALASANQYLQTHMQPGVIHGDFHHGNFKVNDENKIISLFDFSFSGMSPNYLMDFARTPADQQHIIIDEYERQGGRPVDPVMMTMTQISLYAACINWQHNHSQSNNEIKDLATRLYTGLNRVKNITCLEFPIIPPALP